MRVILLLATLFLVCLACPGQTAPAPLLPPVEGQWKVHFYGHYYHQLEITLDKFNVAKFRATYDEPNTYTYGTYRVVGPWLIVNIWSNHRHNDLVSHTYMWRLRPKTKDNKTELIGHNQFKDLIRLAPK